MTVLDLEELSNRPSTRPKILAWASANGIDPVHTPAAQYIDVSGPEVTVEMWVVDENGWHIMERDENGEPIRYTRESVTVPHVSKPSEHGL